MAKKAEPPWSAPPLVNPAPERPAPVVTNYPERPIWIQESDGSLTAQVIPASAWRARVIYVGGQSYQHVADHADGTWIYRQCH